MAKQDLVAFEARREPRDLRRDAGFADGGNLQGYLAHHNPPQAASDGRGRGLPGFRHSLSGGDRGDEGGAAVGALAGLAGMGGEGGAGWGVTLLGGRAATGGVSLQS